MQKNEYQTPEMDMVTLSGVVRTTGDNDVSFGDIIQASGMTGMNPPVEDGNWTIYG